MEKREIDDNELDVTLILRGINCKLDEDKVRRLLIVYIKNNFNLTPLSIGRFRMFEDLWKIVFNSINDTVALNEKRIIVKNEITVTFERPISFLDRSTHITLCYCGRNQGNSGSSDLSCSNCKNWFHTSCLLIKVDPVPVMGDWNYIFLCKNCIQSKKEYFSMTAKRDIDIFYIALYNLDKIYNVSYFSEEKIFGFIEENLESFFNTEESLLDWKLKMLENINDPLNQIDFKYSESHKGWYLESNQNPIFIKSVSDPINFIPQELKKKT